MSRNGMNVAARAEHDVGDAGYIPPHISPLNPLYLARSQRDHDAGATVPRNAIQKNVTTDDGIVFTTEPFGLFRNKVEAGCNVSGFRVAGYREADHADAVRARMPRYIAFDITPFS